MKVFSTRTMGLLTAAALALSLTACGNTASAAQSTDTPEAVVTETAELKGEAKQSNVKLGRVTAVDGDTVTIALNEMGPGGQRQKGMPPRMGQGQTPPALPEGEGTENATGTPPEVSEGQTPPALTEGESTEGSSAKPPQRGETQTVTLSLSQITKDGAAATAEDVAVGTMLKVSVDDSGAPVSAEVLNREKMDRQRDGRKDKSAADETSGATEPATAEETANV